MYNCIIIEDEPLAVERMKIYIEKISYLKLIGSFNDPLDSLQVLKTESVDLIFLDINLGEICGLSFIESVDFNGKVIVTTAYPEHALKGHELNVLDYLLKPFSFERFLKSIERFQHSAQPEKEVEHIFIKTENRLEKISFDEVLFIEGMGDYRRIHCKQKRIMTLTTFGELEQLLPSHKIPRVHKSYMVSIEKIDSIEKQRIKIDEKIIPISESYKKDFMRLIE